MIPRRVLFGALWCASVLACVAGDDEPEAPLSPRGVLQLIALIKDRVDQRCQFIIATHSPILMTYPGATLFRIDGSSIEDIAETSAVVDPEMPEKNISPTMTAIPRPPRTNPTSALARFTRAP